MTTLFQGKTFKRNHQDNSNPYQAQLKQLEKDYIEKFTVAQNIFHRVKHYTSELEILISGVIKVYCGSGFSEKSRIDFLLKNIQNELHDFEERITISEVIEQYDLYPEDLKPKVSPRHIFNDSMLSSTRSDTNTMLAIKNEVKDLISDYKDAVDKLKAENRTIQALVADNKNHRDLDDNKENISFNITRSPNYLKREKSLDESEIENKEEEGKKVSKYAELSRFINDLNKKKEDNMRKLATIETRLATIRKNTTDEEKGALKASDLSREEDRPAVIRSSKKQVVEPGSVSKARTHEDKKDYLNYMKEVTEMSKRKRLGRQKEPLSVNRSKKSVNESSVLEDEIEQLNKEIDTIKDLLDSAIIQKKYQQK